MRRRQDCERVQRLRLDGERERDRQQRAQDGDDSGTRTTPSSVGSARSLITTSDTFTTKNTTRRTRLVVPASVAFSSVKVSTIVMRASGRWPREACFCRHVRGPGRAAGASGEPCRREAASHDEVDERGVRHGEERDEGEDLDGEARRGSLHDPEERGLRIRPWRAPRTASPTPRRSRRDRRTPPRRRARMMMARGRLRRGSFTSSARWRGPRIR